MTLTHTFTRTYEVIEFADPYKVCKRCGAWVDGVLVIPGEMDENDPCQHQAGYRDICPSWGPVDGCRCLEHFGRRDHLVRDICPEGKIP